MNSKAPKYERNLSTLNLLRTLYATEVRQLLTKRRTHAVAVVQMLPVIGAFLYVVLEEVDGLTMFTEITESLMFPFLIPLAAIFFGGPAIVEEMEGRTLTFLTLRPVSKTSLFVGKVLAGVCVALALVLIPLTLLFVVCMVGSGDIGDSFSTFAQIALGVACGVGAYTTIFAALGAAFSSSLLASIIYFVISEMVLASLPVLELLSIRYHLRGASGFNNSERLGLLDQMVLEEPLVFDWWVGVIVALAFALTGLVAGAYIFKERQYHV